MEVPVCLDGCCVGEMSVMPVGRDTELRVRCTGLPAGLYRLYACGAGGELLRLAVPWPPDAPFPLTELFCFACVGQRQGNRYVFFSFSAGWTPCMPGKTGKS